MTTQQNNYNSPRIAIIGAGLTGLITATLLERAFTDATIKPKIDIFEKSAGVGRLATRYHQPDNLANHSSQLESPNKQHQFDFGAPFFTAKSKSFQHFIQPWLQQGVLQTWHANIAYFRNAQNDKSHDDAPNTLNFVDNASIQERWREDKPRYISTPKMTTWGRVIAKQLTMTQIHFKTRVLPLTANVYKDNSGNKLTTLKDDNGNILGEFDWVICTAPSAQAIELFEQTSFIYNDLIKNFEMQACYSLMLGWNLVQQLPKSLQRANWDLALAKNESLTSANHHKSPIIDKVFLEHHKPNRDHILPSVTIHASNEWSQAHVDDDIEEVKATLINSTRQLFDWQDNEHSSPPSFIDCHRWRYAAIANSIADTQKQRAFIDKSHQWIVAGDWCIEGRIESCFESAIKVVNSIKLT